MKNNSTGDERILIVDDLASIREIMSRALVKEGYTCSVAGDGDAALAKLRDAEFHLVLLDLNMPGKSGIEVLKEIVTHHPDAAVIIITANDDTETAIELMKAGAYDYVVKPVNLSTLSLRVERALDRRKLLLENKKYQLYLEEKVKEQAKKIRESFLNSIMSLALALEAKDEYTSGHSQRVAKMSVAISQRLGMTKEQTEKMRLAGLIHDIGKIGIKESVLLKRDPLSDEEYSHIISHSVIGERILRPAIDDKEILGIIRHHHERYDGRGYPDGLLGEQIPIGARILAVADMYDAMTSDRPYRSASSPRIVLDELKRQVNKQFDPVIVKAFVTMMSDANERNYENIWQQRDGQDYR
jgi:putative two-component system response regulator